MRWHSLTIITSILALSACHHDNPLKMHSKQQSANFLMNASANVEKRLYFDVRKDEHGYGYLECMEGKNNPEIHCENLYKGIVAFAKEGHYPDFKFITLNDLTDQTVFAGLKDDYFDVMVSTWPHFFPVVKS